MASKHDHKSSDKALVSEATTILAEIVRSGGTVTAEQNLRAAEFVAKAARHGHELQAA